MPLEIRIPEELGDEERSLLVIIDFHGVEGPLSLERPFRRSCPGGGHDLWVFEFLEGAGSRRFVTAVCPICGSQALLAAA